VVSQIYDNPGQKQNSWEKVSVEVVVPARNEQDCIGRCLESLKNQQGIGFRITVVDDGSTDRTREIAQSFPGVRVIAAPEPAPGVNGKCNALIVGAAGATAKWLLFTDADTFHYPNSLARAVREAEERGVDLLSYSPEQETASLGERALMPVVFAELARTYPPQRVNDPGDPTVAANGQYMLVRREVYASLGGHQVVASKILEDVELARIFKASHHGIWFRQGAGLVSTRMYRNFRSMCEGWTKNLALLFRRPLALAAWRGFEFAAIAGLLIASAIYAIRGDSRAPLAMLAVGTGIYSLFLLRIRRAHFPAIVNLLAVLGLPLFAILLVRSWLHANVQGAVRWKGRIYPHSAPTGAADSSIRKGFEAEN
jgi:glycosyltransferase involved in cell wall biosynthesis